MVRIHQALGIKIRLGNRKFFRQPQTPVRLKQLPGDFTELRSSDVTAVGRFCAYFSFCYRKPVCFTDGEINKNVPSYFFKKKTFSKLNELEGTSP